MRIQIAAVGRMKSGPERELVARYLERAVAGGKPLGLTGFDVSELTESRAGSSQSRKVEEAKALTATFPQGSVVVALDERGKGIGSEALASTIARWRDDGKAAVSFVIGGADGLDPALLAQARGKLAFGPQTWPHALARAMLAEQVYRAVTILAGGPYHRD